MEDEAGRLPTRDQFAGCIIGQCLGDALGFIVEGYPPQVCREYVDGIRLPADAGDRGRGPYPFGQYTDDSQMARELLQSYAERVTFDPGDYAGRIKNLFAEGRVVGYGRATWQAALRLSEGVPWDEAGTPAPSAGNGTAMRAGPVGLLYFDDPEALIGNARDQSIITHKDTRCGAGSVAIAGAVALALRGEEVDREEFLAQLAEWAGEVDESFAEHLKDLAGWMDLEPDEALGFISRAGVSPYFQDGWEGISPFVVGSVLWSLYSFLLTPRDYWQTICTSIAVGGDVDTTAAMAGAISGAHLGLGGLPDDLGRRVNDQGTWGYDFLVDLAVRCHDIKMGKPCEADQK